MLRNDKKTAYRQLLLFLIMIFAAIVIYPGCKKKNAEEIQPEQLPSESLQSQPFPERPARPSRESATGSKITLNGVIRRARTWGPAYLSWHGKNAPDFTLPDTTGKQHTLSSYRGKNVMITFWATWCPPCQMEIPHLKELRRTIGEDKLIMLAITNEKPDMIKKFTDRNRLNYTVLLENNDMPEPFGFNRVYRTSGVPSSFFIDPQGRIKLATTGLIPINNIKAILQAETSY